MVKAPGIGYRIGIGAIICLLMSNISMAQDIAVSLSVKNASFDHIFKEITRQTGYVFLYNTETLQQIKPISIHVKKLPLNQVLDLCFREQPMVYRIVDKMVVISQKKLSLNKPTETGAASLSGIVKDDQTGDPIQGVTVRLYGGAQNLLSVGTDHKGYYSFVKISPGKYKIAFSFIGHAIKTHEFLLTGHQHQIYDVILQGTTGHLNDVVVIGYGEVKNADLTGTVSSVSPKRLKEIPSMSFDDALAGKVPGLQVTKADGSPGGAVKMNIRGGVSLLGTNDPLYIIDGIPVSVNNSYIQTSASIFNSVEEQSTNYANTINGAYDRGINILTGLNMNDIESIDVLKDASSSAIYGSKAANGVVMITTKRGKLNTGPAFSFNYYMGTSVPVIPQLLNTDQYKEILTEAQQNDPYKFFTLQAVDSTIHTNWLDLVTRTGFIQNTDFSISGGGAASSYYASTSYTNEQGILIGTGFKRIAEKINFGHNWSPRFRVLTNFNFGYTQNDVNSGIYGQALHAPPDVLPYYTDGSFTPFSTLDDVLTFNGVENPLALANVKNRVQLHLILGQVALEYDWNKNLKWRSTASVNYNNYHQLQFIPSYIPFNNASEGIEYVAGTSFGANASSTNTDILYENTITWNVPFKKDHQLNLLAGTSWETDRVNSFEAEGSGFPDTTSPGEIEDAVNSKKLNEQNSMSVNNLLSFYIRANYNYKHNYLFTFTGRSDASSKYPSSNRTGYFPSAAFAWRISGENFMKNQSWIDDLKLRISAGKTGLSANINDNLYNTFYANSNYAGSKAIVLAQAGNENLKWESVWQNDAGLDFTLFKSRLNGTIGYYRKVTQDLLLGTDLPPSIPSTILITNTAGITNKGLELYLQGYLMHSDKFQWEMSFNIAHNSSKVTHINGNPFSSPLYRYSTLGTSVVEEGKPLGLIYGYRAEGVLKTQDEVQQYEKVFSADRSNDVIYSNLGIGDYKYELDAEGIPVKSVIGNGNPKFYGGFTQDLTFKNFSLIANVTYSYGNQLLYQEDVNNMDVMDNSNKGVGILNRFTSQNTNTDRPRLVYLQLQPVTNHNVYDASFLKMRALTFNYKFPENVLRKIKMKSLSLYITGTNLFTLTKYPGPDPEVSNDPRSTIGGYSDVSSYPTTRSYVMGVRVGL